MTTEKDIFDVLSALLTPTIALVAVGVGLMQWQLNRARLKHELFDRRYDQYKAAIDFLHSISREGRPTSQAQIEYQFGTSGVGFLFSNEIEVYLHERVWCVAIDLECAQSQYEGATVGEDRSKYIREAGELKKQLYAEQKEIKNQFSRYLQLRH